MGSTSLSVLATIITIIAGLIAIYQYTLSKSRNQNSQQPPVNAAPVKDYITKPVDEILASLKDKTDLQAQQIIKELYIGKFIKDKFAVADVTEGEKGLILSLKSPQAGSIGSIVLAYFDKSKKDTLMQLREGDLVKIEGEIYSMDRFRVIVTDAVIQEYDQRK